MSPEERWPRGLKITAHARDTMSRRDVDPEDIGHVLRQPDSISPDGDAERFFRGPLCVVVRTEGGCGYVVTVLLRTGTRWSDEDMRKAMASHRGIAATP